MNYALAKAVRNLKNVMELIKRKPALKRVFFFKTDQINQSISSSIHLLEQG